jgi:crotonobetainyl-CoA:carnitine CoA-transferase CaiB-like acyl-CoA transferase
MAPQPSTRDPHRPPHDEPTGPLSGVTVVDLTSMVSGPLATSILGDQGADVIKVEVPGTGDLIRHIGCSRGSMSAIFNTINRNKRSVVIDLGTEKGKALLAKLVASADVFVQNFRPGVAERMGIGERDLRAINDRLVYVSISGFGEAGPYANRRVYDIVIQALSGMAASQADPTTGRPDLVRNIVCDKITALHAAQAISAALFARERGAGGQHVKLSMLDASIAFLWPDVMQRETFLGDGATAAAPLTGILSVHETRDGFVTLLAISDAEFEGLCRALGKPELQSDPRFATIAARMENSEVLAAIIREYTAAHDTEEVCRRLDAEGVPSARINAAADLHLDPQVIANALLADHEHEVCGPMRLPRPIADFDVTPAAVRRLAPALGQHTDEVLAELGVMAAEIAELRAQAVVA